MTEFLLVLLSVLLILLLIVYAVLRVYSISRIGYLFESNQHTEEVKEVQEIFALNSAGNNSLSWWFFLWGFNTSYWIEYKYLINTDNWFQLKTTRDNGSIFIKEVEWTTGNKIKITKSIKHLKTTILKTAYDVLWEDEFNSLAESYDKTIFEVPKWTVKLLFDIDISK